MPDRPHRDTTLASKLTATEKSLVDRAADLSGESTSAFVRKVVLREARSVLQRYLDEAAGGFSGPPKVRPKQKVPAGD